MEITDFSRECRVIFYDVKVMLKDSGASCTIQKYFKQVPAL